MNSIHDLGGMDGFGPLDIEVNEPVFHETWEGRVFALFAPGNALGPWNRGRNYPWFRFSLESIPPDEYLRMSYYERWFAVLTQNLLSAGLVSEHELSTGHRDSERPLPTILPRPEGGVSPPPVPDPEFSIGDDVRVRNLHPRGHTRVPRYVRGKRGIVVTDNGVWGLQDTDEKGKSLGNSPQHVYAVRFESWELWGERASSRDVVCVDLWEEYIEPA